MRSSHNIKSLYKDLLGSCKELGIPVPELLFKSTVDIFNKYELTETWARYPKSHEKNHVAEEVKLPIVKMIEELEKLFDKVTFMGNDETLENELYSEWKRLSRLIEDNN